nr:reverse transcriptase [Tanacetum cinerariifolium]
ATAQWFSSVEGFRKADMNAINQVVWTPSQVGELISGSQREEHAHITGDRYKNGGEVKNTGRHSRMDVDPSGRDNHFGPGRGGNHSQEAKRLSWGEAL